MPKMTWDRALRIAKRQYPHLSKQRQKMIAGRIKSGNIRKRRR